MPPTIRKLNAGDFIFKEGEDSDRMFIIQKGSIDIRKKKGGSYVEIARLQAGEVLGELSFFDRQKRSASAIALTQVEVLEIHFESLDKIYAGVPSYIKTIISVVAERLRKSNETIRRLQKEGLLPENIDPIMKDSDS